MFFKMNECSAVDDVQNDFQHVFNSFVCKYGEHECFPDIDKYGTDEVLVDEYLFERQAILDSVGTERSRYTLAGVLIILPVVFVAAFPDSSLPFGKYTVFLGMAFGLLLYAIVYFIRKLLMSIRMQKLEQEYMEESKYVCDVLAFLQEVKD